MDKNFSPIKERILQYIVNNNIVKEKFFNEIGISYSNFKGNGLKSEIGGEKIAKILTKFPDLNSEWLLTGKGEMLRGAEPASQQPEAVKELATAVPVSDGVMAIYKELLREKDEKITQQAEQIGAFKKEDERKNELIRKLDTENERLKNDIIGYRHEIAKLRELPFIPAGLAAEPRAEYNRDYPE